MYGPAISRAFNRLAGMVILMFNNNKIIMWLADQHLKDTENDWSQCYYVSAFVSYFFLLLSFYILREVNREI